MKWCLQGGVLHDARTGTLHVHLRMYANRQCMQAHYPTCHINTFSVKKQMEEKGGKCLHLTLTLSFQFQNPNPSRRTTGPEDAFRHETVNTLFCLNLFMCLFPTKNTDQPVLNNTLTPARQHGLSRKAE